VNTRRGIQEKFKLPEKSKIAADEEEASGIICNAMDILYVLEMNLAFYAWYKRGEPFPVNDPISIAAVRKSITVLLKTIKDFTPCNHGNGWKLQKFHEILHVPMDIYMFGSPQNYDNSPTEHGLIETAKRPADHAQKSRALFISQVTKRLLETVLINKAKEALLRSRQLKPVSSKPDIFSMLPNSASFRLTFDDDRLCFLEWLGKKYLKDSVALNPILLSWINYSKKNKKSFFYEVDEAYIHLEYSRNGVTFRCHPNFKLNVEWYDWVMVRFDCTAHKGRKRNGNWPDHYFPSKILCFFEIPQDNTIYAIIRSTQANDHKSDSILFERWKLENSISVEQNAHRNIMPVLHVVDVSTFGDPILVIEDSSTSDPERNMESQMITVVLPFIKVWPIVHNNIYL